MSSPQWKPPRSNGRGVGACKEMHVVSGRASCLPRLVKETEVSPRPWRRMRTLVVCGDRAGGGVIDRTSDVGNLTSLRRRVGICGKLLRLSSTLHLGQLYNLYLYLGVVGKGWSIVRSRYRMLICYCVNCITNMPQRVGQQGSTCPNLDLEIRVHGYTRTAVLQRCVSQFLEVALEAHYVTTHFSQQLKHSL